MELKEVSRLFDAGKTLWNNRDYKEAAKVLKQAAKVLKQAAQEAEGYRDSRSTKAERKKLQDITLEIWDWCAVAMHDAGEYEDAIACNNRNLAMRLGHPDYGPREYDTLENRRRLVANYSILNQHDKAIAECREILEVVDGTDDRNALAQNLFQKGDNDSFKEAVNINLYTLRRDEKDLGRDELSVCQARYNLGVELCKLGKLDDAREFLSKKYNNPKRKYETEIARSRGSVTAKF